MISYLAANKYKIIFLLILVLIFNSCSDTLQEIIEPEIIDAPSHLQITRISWNEELISWVDNSNNEDGYILERSISAVSDTIIILPANTTSCLTIVVVSDTNTVIQYRLYAYKGSIKSSPAINSSKRNLVPALSNLRYEHLSTSTVKLTWQDHSNLETGIIIERKINEMEFQRVAVLSPNKSEYIDNELDTNIIYSYRVAALLDSVKSNYSNQVNIRYGLIIEQKIVCEDSYAASSVIYIPNTDKMVVIFCRPYGYSADRNVRIYNLKGILIQELPANHTMAAVSPSGKIIATTKMGADINIWDTETGALIKIISRQNPALHPRNMVISPHDDYIAFFESRNDHLQGNLQLYNIITGTLNWSKADQYVLGKATHFTPDGNNFMYTNNFGLTVLVKISNGNFVKTFTNISNTFEIIFSNSGRYCVLLTRINTYTNAPQNHNIYLCDFLESKIITKISAVSSSYAYAIEYPDRIPSIFYSKNFSSDFVVPIHSRVNWQIYQGSLSSNIFSAPFQYMKFTPDGDQIIGYGMYSSVYVMKSTRRWVEL
jgi:WD40 repeat protein